MGNRVFLCLNVVLCVGALGRDITSAVIGGGFSGFRGWALAALGHALLVGVLWRHISKES